ncbi:MAG: hypothetical protein HKN36_04470 [Hellea sp.]|nr:hypothetical protein [Hellea sp.]
MKLSPLYLAIPILLAIPLVAMQFTDEVNWGALDFLVMGGLLTIAALAIDYIWRKYDPPVRALLIIVILSLFALVWAEMAVGVLGTPFAGK